jgi:hypothetical protein
VRVVLGRWAEARGAEGCGPQGEDEGEEGVQIEENEVGKRGGDGVVPAQTRQWYGP